MKKISRRSLLGGAVAITIPIVTGVKGSLSSALAAEAQSGKLVFFRGDVKINERSAILGGAIRRGDLITTGDRSVAEVILADRSIMRIRENTQMEFSEFGSEVRANLFVGRILSKIRKMGKGFMISTPTIVASVSGTVFFTEATPDPSHTYLCACNGSVDVFSEYGAEEKTGNVTGTHHTAFKIFEKEGQHSMERDIMKNHDDEEIAALEANFQKYKEP